MASLALLCVLVAARGSSAGVADDTYYKTLSVPVDASHTEIRKAYRALALRWHPDKNPQDREHAQAQFIKLANAYALHSNAPSICPSASLPLCLALEQCSVFVFGALAVLCLLTGSGTDTHCAHGSGTKC